MPLPLTEDEKKLKHNVRLFTVNKTAVDGSSRTRRPMQKRYQDCDTCEPIGWASHMKRANDKLMRHTILHPTNQNPVKFFEDCYTKKTTTEDGRKIGPVTSMRVKLIGEDFRVCLDQPLKSHATMSFEVIPPLYIIEPIKLANNTTCIDVDVPPFPEEYRVKITLTGYGIQCGKIEHEFIIYSTFFTDLNILPRNVEVVIGSTANVDICIDMPTSRPASLNFVVEPDDLLITHDLSADIKPRLDLEPDHIDFPIGAKCVTATIVTEEDVTSLGAHPTKVYFSAEELGDRVVVSDFIITVIPVAITSMEATPDSINIIRGDTGTIEICYSSTLKSDGELVFTPDSGNLSIPTVPTKDEDSCSTIVIPTDATTDLGTFTVTATLIGSDAEGGSITTTFTVNVIEGITSMNAVSIDIFRGESKTTTITLSSVPSLSNTISFAASPNIIPIPPITTDTSNATYNIPVAATATTACGLITVTATITGENVSGSVSTTFTIDVVSNVTAIAVTPASTTIKRGTPTTVMVNLTSSVPLILPGSISYNVTPVVPNGLAIPNTTTAATPVYSVGIPSVDGFLPNATAIGTYTVTATFNGADSCTPVSTQFTVIVDPVCVNISGTPVPTTQSVVRGKVGTPVVITFDRVLEVDALLTKSATPPSIVLDPIIVPKGSSNVTIPIEPDFSSLLLPCSVDVTITGGYMCGGSATTNFSLDILPNLQCLTQVDKFDIDTASAGRMLKPDGVTPYSFSNAYFPNNLTNVGQRFAQFAIVSDNRIVVVSRNIDFITIWAIHTPDSSGDPANPNRKWIQEEINWAGDPPPPAPAAVFKVAASGDSIIVGGANTVVAGNIAAGAMRLLKRYATGNSFNNGPIWRLVNTINNPNPGFNMNFGRQMAVTSNYLATGAALSSSGGGGPSAHNWMTGSGRVYVYKKDPSTGLFPNTPFVILRSPTSNPGELAAGNGFGFNVEFQYNNLVIAEPVENPTSTKKGAVHLYIPDSNGNFSSTPSQSIRATDGGAVGLNYMDAFGANMRTIKDKLIVGAPGQNFQESLFPNTGQGNVYIFSLIEGQYINGIQVIRPVGAPVNFGTAVGIGDFYYGISGDTYTDEITYFYGEMNQGLVSIPTVGPPGNIAQPPPTQNSSPLYDDEYGQCNEYGDVGTDASLGRLYLVGARGTNFPSATFPNPINGNQDPMTGVGRLYIFKVADCSP